MQPKVIAPERVHDRQMRAQLHIYMFSVQVVNFFYKTFRRIWRLLQNKIAPENLAKKNKTRSGLISFGIIFQKRINFLSNYLLPSIWCFIGAKITTLLLSFPVFASATFFPALFLFLSFALAK